MLKKVVFFRKKENQVKDQIAELEKQKAKLEASLPHQTFQNQEVQQEAPPQPTNQPQSKQAIYLKNLEDLEKITWYCKQKGWHSPQDWKANDVPMQQMARDLIKATKEYVDQEMEQIRGEFSKVQKDK